MSRPEKRRFASARSAHWTKKAWAKRWASRPARDTSETFARLSTQMTREPRTRPATAAKKPGAAPVLRTTSGRKRRTAHRTCRKVASPLVRDQRLASRTA